MVPRILAARRLVPASGEMLEGGGIEIQDGRVRRILRTRPSVLRAASAGAELEELDGLLVPGFVNAHAHLELSTLRGRLPGEDTFAAWIRALLAARPAEADRRAGVALGAERVLAGGGTCVGDIDSSGTAAEVLADSPLHALVYREVLDVFDPERTAAAVAALGAEAEGNVGGARAGLSAHAPYTCSDELLRAVAEASRRRGLPVAVHWAETEEELEWQARGTGPLAELTGAPRPSGPGLARLAAAGLLGPHCALIHANHATAEEVREVARAGATVVHCPGAHRFFGRAPFDWRRWREAGVPVALGTDSLAGNEELDMLRELTLLRESTDASPEEALEAAWAGGARALGLAGEVGSLQPGARADALLFGRGEDPSEGALEALTGGGLPLLGVWTGGCPRATGGSQGA